jgi:glycosyltransferase involved in cell wall biosynthesis
MTVAGKKFVIGWKVSSLTADMASVRYRAMLPLLALEAKSGCVCRIFSDPRDARLAELDVLVVVKSFSADDLALTQRAVSLGVPVILDLCDNIFVPGYGLMQAKLRTSPAQTFLAMSRLAKCIVVTTEPLAQVTRSQVGQQVPVHVIPDGLETPGLLTQMHRRLTEALTRPRESWRQQHRQRLSRLLGLIRKVRTTPVVPLTKLVARRAAREMHWRPWAKRAYRQFDRLRKSLRQRGRDSSSQPPPEEVERKIDPAAKRILWFGNHGAPHARFGMLDLLEIREALEAIATELNVELVIISNNREKFDQHIKPLKIPSSYVPWSPAAVREHLALASVVVVPGTRDAFSICKSANRTATALLAGVPVVATTTPALEVLRDCVVLDDFVGGLRLYLTDRGRATSDVQKGMEIVHREFGQTKIATRWIRVIDDAMSLRGKDLPDGELVVALNILQDFDIALPVVRQAMSAGVSVVVYLNIALAKSRPKLLDDLHERGIKVSLLPEEMLDDHEFQFPPSAKALLTAAESNLGPHRFTRLLTEAANSRNIFTATLQHGFENIGLTYTDEFQPIESIDFAARKIYIWGQLETLHPKINSATKEKCFPVGCPKPAKVPRAELDGLLNSHSAVVGVFENLHWRRFSEEYRHFFIDNVQRVASLFPEVLFLIKPHHAGRWLTARFEGAAPGANNIIVADPLSPMWGEHTAPSLMGYLKAVITTPSTVAMDAARQDLPVAVIAHQMDLWRYMPLTMIRVDRDWEKFVGQSLDNREQQPLIEESKKFVSKNLLGEGAAERITQDICSRVAAGAVVPQRMVGGRCD